MDRDNQFVCTAQKVDDPEPPCLDVTVPAAGADGQLHHQQVPQKLKPAAGHADSWISLSDFVPHRGSHRGISPCVEIYQGAVGHLIDRRANLIIKRALPSECHFYLWLQRVLKKCGRVPHAIRDIMPRKDLMDQIQGNFLPPLSMSEMPQEDDDVANANLAIGLSKWVPKVHAITQFSLTSWPARSFQTAQDERKYYYIFMENATGHMKDPCVMDVKLGTRTDFPSMTAETRAKRLLKDNKFAGSCHLIGAAISSAAIQRNTKLSRLNRIHLESLQTEEECALGIRVFLGGLPTRADEEQVCRQWLSGVREIKRNVMETQNAVKFRGSSLLLMYDTNGISSVVDGVAICPASKSCEWPEIVSNQENDLGKDAIAPTMSAMSRGTNLSPSHLIKWVDFAHVFRSELDVIPPKEWGYSIGYDGSRDEGCLSGLRFLEDVLFRVLEVLGEDVDAKKSANIGKEGKQVALL